MSKPFEKSVSFIEGCVRDGLVSSAALAIGVGDKTYVKKCFGTVSSLEGAEAVTEDTVYDMASVSKILSTTMITLRFIAQGKLDLVDTLYRHLGDIVPESENKRDITLFHVLTHTAGFKAHILIEDYAKTPEDALRILLEAPLDHDFHTGKVVYSCTGFLILGMLLEKISGKPLDVLAKEEVYDPLGMTSTGYHRITYNKEGQKTSPSFYEHTCYTERNHITGEWLVGEVHDENAYYMNGVAGNAGIFSNLRDMQRFAKMLTGHGTIDGQVYIPRRIFDVAIQCHTNDPEERRGLGFQLACGYDSMSGQFFSQNGFGHNGFTGPHILVDPDTGLFVLMLLNRVHPDRTNSNHLRMRRILHTLAVSEFYEMNK